MLSLGAAWKIVADVVVYRLQKKEAGNLATSLTLAWALGSSWSTLAVRAAFGAVLNAFVYLVNDCFDVAIDLAAEGRHAERTVFLAEHIKTAWVTVAVMAAGLVGFGWWAKGGLLAAALVNIVIIFAYSKVLKHMALLDLVAMAVWGVSMAMVGFDWHDARGWRLAAVLGMLSVVTECVQVLRDLPTDEVAGVRTTAVVLGARTTAVVARAVLCGAAIYAGTQVHPVGFALAAGVLVKLTPADARRSWDQLRVLFGATWLVMMALVRLRG